MAELPVCLSCPALPSQRSGELGYFPMPRQLSKQPRFPTVPYLQELCSVAEAGEETMGLAWKKLSSQLYSRISLGSTVSTHTSTLQHSSSRNRGSHLLPLCHRPGLSSWSNTCLSGPHQAALPRQDGSSPERAVLWRRKTPLAVLTPLVAGDEAHSGAAFGFPLTTDGLSQSYTPSGKSCLCLYFGHSPRATRPVPDLHACWRASHHISSAVL